MHIIFDMPNENYHDALAMSSSAIKSMLVSPAEFWARHVMNWKEPDTNAHSAGSLYHTMMVEGHDAFYERYCAQPGLPEADLEEGHVIVDTIDEMREWLRERTPALPEGALLTTADKRAWLKSVGEKQAGADEELNARIIGAGGQHLLLESDPRTPYRLGGTKDELRERIRALAPEAEFLSEWEDKTIAGRHVVSDVMMDELHRARQVMIDTGYMNLMVAGQPEVSIFWRSQGIDFKARIDRLMIHPDDRIVEVDYKTWISRTLRPLDEVVVDRVRFDRLGIQRALYLRGLTAMQHAKEITAERFGHEELTEGQAEFVDILRGAARQRRFPRSIMVFQRRAEAPIVAAREYEMFDNTGQATRYWRRDESDIDYALQRYARWRDMTKDGARPWGENFLVDGARPYDDSEFPAYYLGDGDDQ